MASFLRFRRPAAGPAKSEAALSLPSTGDLATAAQEPGAPSRPLNLMSLPAEIHVLIAEELIYPDALSLKHTNRYFGRLVDTGVRLKVAWLMERRMLHLECPNNTRCDLGSDLRFCRGSVALLMQRRREHLECESRPGLGCLVYGTRQCDHAKKWSTRAKRWLRIGVTVELWWLLLAWVPIVLAWFWMGDLLGWATGLPATTQSTVLGDW